MENFKVIELQQARDFSRKMNATFEFVKQNFKSLFKSILFIAGPPALIGGMLFGSFFGEFMNITQRNMKPNGNPQAALALFTSVGFWLQIVMMTIFMVIASVVLLATINGYITLYHEKRTNK